MDQGRIGDDENDAHGCKNVREPTESSGHGEAAMRTEGADMCGGVGGGHEGFSVVLTLCTPFLAPPALRSSGRCMWGGRRPPGCDWWGGTRGGRSDES